jgi:hypothetical protein
MVWIKEYASAFGLCWYFYILGGGIHTINNTEAVVVASKENRLEMLIILSIWSCLEIRIQNKSQYKDLKHFLQREQKFGIWKQPYKIKVTFRKQQRADWRQGTLSFGADSFVFHFSIKEYQHSDIQNYNFACCFVWVWNLVAHTEEGA